MNKTIACFSSIVVCILVAGCLNPVKEVQEHFNKAPEIDAFTKAVKVSLPLGYAANCAMNAAVGKTMPGVTVVTGFDTFPCFAFINIAVNASHPLPVGASALDTVTVLGLWDSQDEAVVSVIFRKGSILDGTFTLKNVAFVPVVRDTNGCMVVFASEDVNIDSQSIFTAILTDSIFNEKQQMVPDTLPIDSSVAVNQKAWIVKVKNSTDTTLGNETYHLYGASQYIGVSTSTAEVVQAVMLDVRFTPSVCRRNPNSGIAMIRTIKVLDDTTALPVEMGTTILTFDDVCDGRANIPFATGVYLGRIGSTASLNLDQ